MLTIYWTCSTCGQKISNGAGRLYFHPDETYDYRERVSDWHSMRKNPHVMTASDFTTYPSSPQWRGVHHQCKPQTAEQYGYAYDIDVERICTLADVLEWTAHLMDKDWFADSDWQRVIHQALEQQGHAFGC